MLLKGLQIVVRTMVDASAAHLVDLGALLKERALAAKTDAEHASTSVERAFHAGRVMAHHEGFLSCSSRPIPLPYRWSSWDWPASMRKGTFCVSGRSSRL